MNTAISQPTYFPWLGYFDLIDQADTFVLLDTVQFGRQSWQQRNRIKVPNGLLYLTVPVAHKGRFGQFISDVQIKDWHFARKHLRSIEMNYHRSPFFDRYFPGLAEILRSHSGGGRLVDLTVDLIEYLCVGLGVRTPLLRASTIALEGNRSSRLVNLCRHLGADSYLAPFGSANYLLDDLDRFSDAGVSVTFQNYRHPEYRQLYPPFRPYASVIDLIFNEGERALDILRSGRRTPFLPGEILPGRATLEVERG
jgi:hypothetical protein